MTDVIELTRQWLDVLPEGRFDDLPGRISPDFVLRLPYAPPGVPEEFRGRELAQLVLSASAKGRSKLILADVTMLRTEDPELVVTTATGKATMANGRIYENSYVIFTRIRDGMVIEHIEYLNPLKVIEASAQQD